MLFDEARRFSQVLRSIETSGKPWAAAINGLALGGGFEITLSCHYRVAAENPKTRLGLPEVKVGLFPGAGGTQRVPRLVPPQDAMTICSRATRVTLDKAKQLNLIHAIVPAADLIKAAKDWIKGGGKAVAPWDEKGFKLPAVRCSPGRHDDVPGRQRDLSPRDLRQLSGRARDHASCVYEGLQLPIDTALRVESRATSPRLRSKEAAAMIRSLFLSMQELNKGARRPKDVPATKVKKIAVIGAGFMGASVGYVSARAGLDVVLIDRDQESADKGKAHAQKVIEDQIKKGRAKADGRRSAARPHHADRGLRRAEGRRPRHRGGVRGPQGQGGDLRQGAGVSRSADVIFASNTSTLPITSLAEGFKDQGKFVGIHFFSPVEKMMLVEIIKGKNTGDVALATALDYVRQIGKTPIVVNDSRGFFANRCVGRYVAEGNEMFLEGVPPAMIENCAKMAGMPVGPLSLSDEVALDLGLKIMKATGSRSRPERHQPRSEEADGGDWSRSRAASAARTARASTTIPRRARARRACGRASRRLQPKQLDPDTLDIEELKQRFLVVQAVEAARTVEEHVVTDPREADVGSILGFGFAPFTGGTLSYIDFMGTKKFVELCDKLEAKYGSRFTPPKLLEEMAAKGETFYGRFAPKKAAAA